MQKLIVNDREQIVFVDDLDGINKILSEYGLLKSDGSLYNDIVVDRQVFTYGDVLNGVIANKISYRGIIIWMVLSVNKINTSIGDLYQFINKCGNPIVKIDGVIYSGNLSYNSEQLKIGNSTLSSKKSLSNDSFIHTAMAKISHDNGRMLDPISNKFTSIVKLAKSHAKMFTGYADLITLFDILKQPMNKLDDSVINVKFDKSVTVTYNVVDNKLICEVNGISVSDESAIRPYIIYTLKPIKLQNQNFPFQVIKKHGLNLFLTPVILNNEDLLKDLRGGINLLK